MSGGRRRPERLRVRTLPVPLQRDDPFAGDEQWWSAACPDCRLRVDTDSRAALVEVLLEHRRGSGHAQPLAVSVLYVVERGTGVEPRARSRMSVTFHGPWPLELPQQRG